jgi:hypothetical protein
MENYDGSLSEYGSLIGGPHRALIRGPGKVAIVDFDGLPTIAGPSGEPNVRCITSPQPACPGAATDVAAQRAT